MTALDDVVVEALPRLPDLESDAFLEKDDLRSLLLLNGFDDDVPLTGVGGATEPSRVVGREEDADSVKKPLVDRLGERNGTLLTGACMVAGGDARGRGEGTEGFLLEQGWDWILMDDKWWWKGGSLGRGQTPDHLWLEVATGRCGVETSETPCAEVVWGCEREVYLAVCYV